MEEDEEILSDEEIMNEIENEKNYGKESLIIKEKIKEYYHERLILKSFVVNYRTKKNFLWYKRLNQLFKILKKIEYKFAYVGEEKDLLKINLERVLFKFIIKAMFLILELGKILLFELSFSENINHSTSKRTFVPLAVISKIYSLLDYLFNFNFPSN
jgi:hypothetical protein